MPCRNIISPIDVQITAPRNVDKTGAWSSPTRSPAEELGGVFALRRSGARSSGDSMVDIFAGKGDKTAREEDSRDGIYVERDDIGVITAACMQEGCNQDDKC